MAHMNNKKLTGIMLVILMLITTMPIASAINTAEENVDKNIKDLNSGESCFVIGTIHADTIKIPWGWTIEWTPIYLLQIGHDGKHVLEPTVGPINVIRLYFVGPRYLHCLNLKDTNLFICGKIAY